MKRMTTEYGSRFDRRRPASSSWSATEIPLDVFPINANMKAGKTILIQAEEMYCFVRVSEYGRATLGLNRDVRMRFAARSARIGGSVERNAKMKINGREVLKGKTEDAEERIHEMAVPVETAR